MSSIYEEDGTVGILVGSTEVLNAINMNITLISNLSGDINCEVSLIYVIERDNGMHIYFNSLWREACIHQEDIGQCMRS